MCAGWQAVGVDLKWLHNKWTGACKLFKVIEMLRGWQCVSHKLGYITVYLSVCQSVSLAVSLQGCRLIVPDRG